MPNFLERQFSKRAGALNGSMNSSWNSLNGSGGAINHSTTGGSGGVDNLLRASVVGGGGGGGGGENTIKLSRSAWKRYYKAKREAKVVQKSAGHVDKIVAELTDGKPFLLSTPNQPIAKFHRSEIVVGNLIGRGVFARVYEIKDFDLHGDEEEEELEHQQQVQQQKFNTTLADLEEIQELEADSEYFNDNESARPLGIATIDERPLGMSRDLTVISEDDSAEDENDWDGEVEGEQHPSLDRQETIPHGNYHRHSNSSNGSQENHGGDDSTTAGTSSTAQASAPPTPPLTPASQVATEATSYSSTPLATTTNASRPRPIRQSLRNSQSRPGASSTRYLHLMSDSRRQIDQSSLRLRARDVIRSGEAKYTLKHLTQTLLRNPKDFYLAAAALLVEAKYLSKLNHPNIIKITGLAANGGQLGLDAAAMGASMSTSSRGLFLRSFTGADHSRRNSGGDHEGIESGQYDSYFLISERLTDTLDRRIRQWKREQPTHKKLSEQSPSQRIQTWKHMMRKTSYALQLSNALAYMHERKLLYRDLRPQNIGFIGDNQTIVIFNFGLCRELDPTTGTVQEDEVTALYGALGWRYTAVECFPQPVVHTPTEFLANSTKFLHSSQSFGLDAISVSSSFRGRSKRRANMDTVTLKELERELLVAHQKFEEELGETNAKGSEQGSLGSAQQLVDLIPPKVDRKEKKKDAHIRFVLPPYDVKADVYSWAMVYYEMLTLRQPFSGMTQKEHLRKVAGPKGGQRPGVYQFDLTPSMISLLQRAWDQDPTKRPTMESVGRNLQLILRELEELIKKEQKDMIKSAGGASAEALTDLASKMDRAAKRAIRKAEKMKRRLERMQKLASEKSGRSGPFSKSMTKLDNIFSRNNNYRRSDARESVMAPPHGVVENLSSPTACGSAAVPPSPPMSGDRMSEVSKFDVDLAALEYEMWSDEDGEGSSSPSSSSDNSGADGDDDASSLTDNLVETEITVSSPDKNDDKEIIAPTAPGEADIASSAHGSVHHSESSSSDAVGGAISALRSKKKESRSLPSQNRSESSQNSRGLVPRLRRTTTSAARAAKPRQNLFNPFSSLERRGTNRMSRRTMRLSRASIWMMRRDVRIFVIVFGIVLSIALSGAGWIWYKKRQGYWLGINLIELSHEYSNDPDKVRDVLHSAMAESCRREIPVQDDPNAPLLFQGGALSPVDLVCMESLEQVLEYQIAKVTGVDIMNKDDSGRVGFLKLKQFKRPPPQIKQSKWRRKKPWKFFRGDLIRSSSNSGSASPSDRRIKVNKHGNDVEASAAVWPSTDQISTTEEATIATNSDEKSATCDAAEGNP